MADTHVNAFKHDAEQAFAEAQKALNIAKAKVDALVAKLESQE